MNIPGFDDGFLDFAPSQLEEEENQRWQQSLLANDALLFGAYDEVPPIVPQIDFSPPIFDPTTIYVSDDVYQKGYLADAQAQFDESELLNDEQQDYEARK